MTRYRNIDEQVEFVADQIDPERRFTPPEKSPLIGKISSPENLSY
jgi:hypothetical protein